MQIGRMPAYADERDFQPKFTAVRPSTTGIFGGTNALYFNDFRVVTQDAPDTVPSATTNLKLFSNLADNYNPASGGLKIVAHLATSINSASFSFAELILDCVDGTIGTPLPSITTSASFDLSVSASIFAQSIIRVRPVLQNFNPGLATWNVWESSPPTLGTAIERVTAQTTFSCSLVGLPPSSNAGSACLSPMVKIPVTITDDIYGFYIDIKPHVVSGTATAVSSSMDSFVVLTNNVFVVKVT